ncbi:MAG: hypothetical protein DMF65_08045 [Acidobacteria bacterium]|nr:MAG: hypothetical protein DMF65_08045 [Acidobacteriota bacterium]
MCRESPIKPVEGAIGVTFRGSRRVLRAAASLPEEERELEPVVTRLQRAIAAVPEDHFRHLRERLDARLGLGQSRER